MSIECKLCQAKTSSINHPKLGEFNYCCSCEYIFKSEKDIVSIEDELIIYNKHENSIEDTRYVANFIDFIDDAIIPYVKKEEVKVLDYGSGPSPVLSQILKAKYNYDIDLYDKYFSPNKIFTNKKYDLVTSTEVIEHLIDPIIVFKELASILNKDGILCIMSLFHHNDLDAFLNWHYIRDRSHISFYTPKTLAFIADKVGLEIIHTNDIRYATFKLINKREKNND